MTTQTFLLDAIEIAATTAYPFDAIRKFIESTPSGTTRGREQGLVDARDMLVQALWARGHKGREIHEFLGLHISTVNKLTEPLRAMHCQDAVLPGRARK